MGDIVQRLGATLSETIDVKSLNGGSKINAAAEAIRRWAAQPVDVLCIHVQRAEDCGIAPASKRKLVGHSPPSPSFNDEAFTSWVQCSRCSKWRRGVVGVAADEEWHCALNSDLNAASCEMPEEKTSETEEQGAIYQVERIVDERRRGGRRQYRVRWLGYTARDDTWEDEENILDPLLLAAWRSKGQQSQQIPRQRPVPKQKARSTAAKSSPKLVTWVQCSRCSKWRKGVVGVAADEEWHCALNSDPNAASCEMREEKASEMEERGAIYQVERIVGERREGGRQQYRVHWLGYTARDDTWEDEKNILDPLLLAAWRSKGQPEAKASPRQPPVQPEAKASLPLNPWLARLETASSDSVNVEECAWAFVAPSDCGRGLFAMTNLLPGQAICQYSGPILPLPLLQKGEYVLQVPRT